MKPKEEEFKLSEATRSTQTRWRWSTIFIVAACAASVTSAALFLHVTPLSTHPLKTAVNSGALISHSTVPSAGDLLVLATEPSEPRRSTILGGTLLQAGFSNLSVHFLRKAALADKANMTLHAAIGEALVLANGGRVVPAAKDEFDLILASNPNDLIARFYMGYWLLQNGKPKAALVKWVGLMRTVGADNLWNDKLWEAMPDAAEQVGVDPLALKALCISGM